MAWRGSLQRRGEQIYCWMLPISSPPCSAQWYLIYLPLWTLITRGQLNVVLELAHIKPNMEGISIIQPLLIFLEANGIHLSFERGKYGGSAASIRGYVGLFISIISSLFYS